MDGIVRYFIVVMAVLCGYYPSFSLYAAGPILPEGRVVNRVTAISSPEKTGVAVKSGNTSTSLPKPVAASKIEKVPVKSQENAPIPAAPVRTSIIPAQTSDKDKNAGKLIKLNFPDGVAVKVLIDYVSDRLGVNILYSDAVAQQRVTVLAPASIPPDSLLGFLRSVLKMSGYSLVDAEQKGWMKVIANQNFIEATTEVKNDMSKLLDAKDMVVLTQIFPLKYAEPTEVDTTIKSFLSKPGGNSFPVASSDIVIVTDYAGNLRRIAEIISLIDKPGGQVEVVFVSLKNTKAEEVAKSLQQVLQQKSEIENKNPARRRTSQGRTVNAGVVAFPMSNQLAVIVEPWAKVQVLDFIKILDSPPDMKTSRYYFTFISPERVMKLVDAVIGEEFKGNYKSAFDEESGLLLVSGPAKLHSQIEALKKELDVAENNAFKREIKFYVIRNAMAQDVLTTIQALDPDAVVSQTNLGGPDVKSGLAAESFSGPNNPPPALGTTNLPKPPSYQSSDKEKGKSAKSSTGEDDQEKKTYVTADLNTNTIIVIAPAAIQKMYEKLINALDKRRPQVLVEVTMVTLDKSDSISLGVELLNAGKISKADYMIFNSFGLSTVDTKTGSLSLNPGVGFNGSVINAGAFSAIVRALATTANAKVMSSPRILVNDNATATLTSVNEQPYTSVNASETVSTTSFAGYASAGSTLTVTPHISEGEHLSLKYTVTLNSFTGEGSEGVPAPRQTNELTSEVTVPDGYTVVVGGLKRNDNTKTRAKVPILGDIPGIGYLFSLSEKSDKESVLFVFIRPIILRDDEFEHLKYISDIDLDISGMKKNFPVSQTIIMN